METGTSLHGKAFSAGEVSARRTAEREKLGQHLIKAGQGSAGDLETVYKMTCGKLYALLLRMLRSEAASQETLQDVYLTVWQKAKTYQPGRVSPMTWLITITRNKAIDRLRADRTLRVSQSIDDMDSPFPDDSPSALHRLVETQERSRLIWCIQQLDDRQRHAIQAAYFGDMTYDMLARANNVPLGTMKSWIRRGLQNLKACLDI